MIYKGKRQNGTPIDERPEWINDRSEFGHWEIDLIEGKRGTKNKFTYIKREKN
jgi:IS30 family transposase